MLYRPQATEETPVCSLVNHQLQLQDRGRNPIDRHQLLIVRYFQTEEVDLRLQEGRVREAYTAGTKCHSQMRGAPADSHRQLQVILELQVLPGIHEWVPVPILDGEQ